MRSFPLLAISAMLTATATLWACNEVSSPDPRVGVQAHHRPGHGGGPGGGDDGADGAFATIVTFRDASTDNIRSDAELRAGDPLYSGPEYEDDVCGAWANLGNFDDARMDPDRNYKKGKHQRTCGDARVLIFEWDQPGDGGDPKPTRVDGIFSNIDQVLTVPAGATELRHGQFNLCSRLIFNPQDASIPNNGSDSLLVSFDDKGTTDLLDDAWTVETQPAPNDKGYCEADGRLWHMPFQMTIQRKP